MENLVSSSSLSSVYQDKKVFITGHTGFKGSWLSAILKGMGAEVRGYALPPEGDKGLFSYLQADFGLHSVFADIRTETRLKEELQAFRPDFIFHLAAQPLVRLSYRLPSETFDVNVTGTARVLEAMAGLEGPCTCVVITTDKVYENKEQDVLYGEDDPLGGHDPYSASKACTELVVTSFRKSFFSLDQYGQHRKGIASARAGNVIGGGDWSLDRIVPDIVRALQSGTEILVRNPASVRPWQHVLEPLAGYLLLGARLQAEPGAYSKAYNFGPLPEDHLTVQELVEQAIRHWGSGSWRKPQIEQQPHEAQLLKLDIGRARTELGWNPKLHAEDAIRWTMDWYRAEDAEKLAITNRQIREYFSL